METLGKLCASALLTVLALIPTWVFLLVYWFLAPHGFWQKMAVLVVGVLVMGSLQVWAFIMWLAALIGVWDG